MKLCLPYPPSANEYWRTWRGRILVSAKARAYKADVAVIAKAARLTPLEGEVQLTINVFRPRLVGDLGNRLKVLEDALEGFAFEDDNQVADIRMRRFLDRENPRVEVEVTPLASEGCHQTAVKLRAPAEDETPTQRMKRLATPNVRRGKR